MTDSDDQVDAAAREAIAEARRQELASEAFAAAQTMAARGLAAQVAINAMGFGPPDERAAAADALLSRLGTQPPLDGDQVDEGPALPDPPFITNTIDDLAYVLGGSGDSWTGDALRLIAKSDPAHRAALVRGIPMHVHAYEAWMSAPNSRAGIEAARAVVRAMHQAVGGVFGSRNRPGLM